MSFSTIYTWACEHPLKPAVIHNGDPISYSALSEAIAATADHLAVHDLPETHTVVVIIKNIPHCWVTILALQALGLNTICVRSTELLEVLQITNVAAIVSTESECHTHQITPDSNVGSRVIAVPDPSYTSTESPRALTAYRNSTLGGHILYTSGTTGNYKKLFFSADLQRQRNAEKSSYNPSTLFHGIDFGLWTAVGYKMPLAAWHVGAGVIFDQRPDWYRHFLQSGLTTAVLIPDMINKLLGALDDEPSLVSPMNFQLTVTSGFVSRNLAEQLINRVTVNLENTYGSTELNLGPLRATVTDLNDLHWLSHREGRTLEIVNEAGDLCPVNEEGQIRIRLTELDCVEYMNDADATEKMFRDGCFYPGDMAMQRADGRVRVLGRSADVVNFRGQKYSVAPIEEKIQNLLGVNAVCLFSGINDDGEDEVIITIESEQWPEQSTLNNLGYEFAQFDQVRFAIVYPFPRTKTGTSKVNRVALRKLIYPVH